MDESFGSHGGYADIYIVMAGGAGPKGVSAFIVSKGHLSFGKKRKDGLRSSPTVEMILEDAVIPAAKVIGQEGQGFTVAMRALDSGRIQCCFRSWYRTGFFG